MTQIAIMRAKMAELLDDAYYRYGLIEAHAPEREPTARLMLADAQRASQLLRGRMTNAKRGELVARLTRADLLARALSEPVQ